MDERWFIYDYSLLQQKKIQRLASILFHYIQILNLITIQHKVEIRNLLVQPIIAGIFDSFLYKQRSDEKLVNRLENNLLLGTE